MKTPKQLAEQLYPYVAGTAKATCMSEIESLLKDIYEYLTVANVKYPVPSVDPSIESQMNLDLPTPYPPRRGDISWQPVTPGLYSKGE